MKLWSLEEAAWSGGGALMDTSVRRRAGEVVRRECRSGNARGYAALAFYMCCLAGCSSGALSRTGVIVCGSAADCPMSDGGSRLACCGGICVDTANDAGNCGACGKACGSLPNATATCTGGRCALSQCDPGYLNCDNDVGNGCEVNGGSDSKNCGQCANPCPSGPNQDALCMAGVCSTTCAMGFAHCSINSAEGCEVMTASDTRNCGACNAACGPSANATTACLSGVCSIGQCAPGFADCDQWAQDGCEVNIQDDPANCGACAKSCGGVPNGTPGCVKGRCAIATCDMGFADCDALYADGCEKAVLADASNCGGCGHMCSGPNSMQSCQAGMCTIASCAQGFADCDMRPETGCEVNLGQDVLNCGGCGVSCATPANAEAGCSNGQCGIGACKIGFADCNMNAGDGCEADLNSVQNCGKCGNVCMLPNAIAGCAKGTCAIAMCSNQWGDCDGTPANGCEANLAADVNNCGACGKRCATPNGSAACVNGQCALLGCNAGFADCNKNIADGCESELNSDAANCGACGAACGQNQLCVKGICRNGLNVLLVEADPGHWTDVQSNLKGTGVFSVVDVFDATAGTPSLQQLQSYDVVLVWSASNFQNSAMLGDNLAAYFDGGGNVVVAVFAVGGANAALLGGKFGTPGNGYMLLAPTGPNAVGTPATLGVIAEPLSALMSGVNSLTAMTAYRGSCPVVNGGVVVASWSDHTPLIVRGTVNGRKRVDLNMWPVSSGAWPSSWKGDGVMILKNALLYR